MRRRLTFGVLAGAIGLAAASLSVHAQAPSRTGLDGRACASETSQVGAASARDEKQDAHVRTMTGLC